MATTTTSGQIQIGNEGRQVFLKVDGRATHTIAPALRRCLAELEACGARSFRLDLSSCTYVDSTFLGVLAGSCLRLKDEPCAAFTITAISPRCLEGLRTLGVDRYCHLELEGEALPEGVELHVLPVVKDATGTWADVVLEAHQALVQVDASNAARFDDVIRMVTDSIARVPPQASPEDASLRRSR